MRDSFNLLKRPTEPETLDAWAKILEDIAKVAILALPVIIYQRRIKMALTIGLFTLAALMGGVVLAINHAVKADKNA